MIPDDEPWWMVRANTDNGLASATGTGTCGSSNALPCTCPLADVADVAMADEPASETERALDSLDFRPIGYEW